ncbi:hypothetical protein [Bradyrhizobium sp. Ash2021]|uniref:hypothetical protein n=1 Tax=Bradyrhizobium sp. Ash2021 TaxID=2954771 RepID=UPI002814E7D0|nr:hypothetical protein [Bradyrhizobium sp. Ash2021]WMT71141.1 hypothetical protein NL528_23875 [Bradyrhizobium sp. Ash2021]
MIDAADLERLKALEGTVPDTDALLPLTSIPEIIAYVVTSCRADGADEGDIAELLVRAADLSPDAVRRAERVLRPLGYAQVSDRLRKIAGRRQHSLAPLES